MLFCCRQIHIQLVTVLIAVCPQYVHTFSCEALSQFNTDELNGWACFNNATIAFVYRVQHLISGKNFEHN
jgi:hypothetical protein